MKIIKNLILLLLVASFAVSCNSGTKSICETKKVKPADVWYKGNNANKVYR